MNFASAQRTIDSNGQNATITSVTTNKNGISSTSTIQKNFTSSRPAQHFSNFQSLSPLFKPINLNILPPKSPSDPSTHQQQRPTTKSTTRITKTSSSSLPPIQNRQAAILSRNEVITSRKPQTTTRHFTTRQSDRTSGKYVHNEDKWAYKPDKSGKYVHVNVPYNGGYGPWVIKGLNPYDHDGRPYDHEDHPFNNQFYNDKRPEVYREYGAPLFNNH